MPDYQLKPGQMLVRLATSDASGINGIGIMSGAVLVTYNEQMGYGVGDNISFIRGNSYQFNTTADIYSIYSLVNQNDVLFKTILPP